MIVPENDNLPSVPELTISTENSDMDASNLVDSVYGDFVDEEAGADVAAGLKTGFAPWHHPAKQIVRDYQWADLALKLIKERPAEAKEKFKYFTLPGADLLDVRFLAEKLTHHGSKVEYFGFDSGYRHDDQDAEDVKQRSSYFAAESSLRQAGLISEDAEILPDRLEDIALSGSVPDNRLKRRNAFDAVNIDACNHLAYVGSGRATSVFDALERLLAHQLKADDPWLLFITTRADPKLMDAPGEKMKAAVASNLKMHTVEFGAALADCINAKVDDLASDLEKCWGATDENFLKLFTVGLGKFLLQFYHAQVNHPASVELVSAFTYAVHGKDPDMLSLAFRISPKGLVVQPPTAGGQMTSPMIELNHAKQVIRKAKCLWDIDQAMISTCEVRDDAIVGTKRLLTSAGYDLHSWRDWLGKLKVRPMELGEF